MSGYIKEVNMVLQYNVREATSVEIVITDFAVDRSYSSEKLLRGLATKVSITDRMVISRAIQYQAQHGVVQALNQMKVPKGSRGKTGQYVNKGTMIELLHVNVSLVKSVQQRYLDNVALLLARFLGGGTLSWDKLVKGIKALGTISKGQAEQIARTEVIRTISTAQKETLLNSGKKEWRWVTQNDERVCKFCGSIDGKVVEIGKPFASIKGQPVISSPAHPNCRCFQEAV
jgi:SPP1 gp7 family putative phage head morphogenesis protein